MQSYEHSSALEAERQRIAAKRTASLARHPQIHETSGRQRRTERAAFPSSLAVPTPDESLNDLTWRMYIAPLRGQARRAAEAIEHRRRVLSAADAQEIQHWNDSLRDLERQGYGAEDDPLVRKKVQEILAEQEYAREQNIRGHYGKALRLSASADLVRIATVWALQTRQIYMQNASAQGRGDVYWQEDYIRLDEASEEELLRSVTSAYFEWRQKLYRSR